ncbi:MAG: DEAD/DEAH box helicase [Alphaproteobacteria bacterium]|nr:DEAD/DEAH box helicase [Alphaproteobacteria bacterium]
MDNQITTLVGFRTKKTYEDSDFQNLYQKLLISENPNEFSNSDKVKLLKWAILFFNQSYDDVKKIGYRIIVRYANLFKDYIPLYDVSLYAGFMPIVRFIQKNHLNTKEKQNRFLNEYISSYVDDFKEDMNDRSVYLSLGQKKLVNFSRSIETDSLIVAPTSYGKSEMIISKVLQNPDGKICIIVPTKALLAQTKKRLLDNESLADKYKRIITHPEMYKKDESNFLAVFTQERLLRLLQQENELSIDMLMIDEAHNLLEDGHRSELLIQVILILKRRNPSLKLHFFTPFLIDSSSIETKYADYSIKAERSEEYIKIQRYFIYDAINKKN